MAVNANTERLASVCRELFAEGWTPKMVREALMVEVETAIELARTDKQEPTNTRCAVCGSSQFRTSSGITCKNGHGGAPSKRKRSEVKR